ncbi:hypothetical protein L596_011375 [Steinernema carpocapsae]|uniref:Fringe-like glycosyltransferase domain-containing protein n=1 Tax=Steinernema carpocapsae TaxID=34508 RepID=A0A4U5NTP2_STECR|nr:hypothetical protein L596_011375 [Steinernema carpocapsae]
MNLHGLLWICFRISTAVGLEYGFLVISQDYPYEVKAAQASKKDVLAQAASVGKNADVLLSHEDFRGAEGSWAVWPLFFNLRERYGRIGMPEWLLIGDAFTGFNLRLLNTFLADFSNSEAILIGRGLKDSRPIIIHHFHGFDRDPESEPFQYCDFSSGVAINRKLLEKLFGLPLSSYPSGFTIDANFELSKFINDTTGTTLKSTKAFCYKRSSDCITWNSPPDHLESNGCRPKGFVNNDNVFFAVKTFVGFHKTRVVVVKRTWARTAKYVEYFSDFDDRYVPTIDLGVKNTERGHCEKTIRILRHFLEHEELKNVVWIVVADDDTLLSVPRLYKHLECVNENQPVIVGERYGYGFAPDATGGYSYPTGGAGMIFSRSGAEKLAKSCECPSIDAPDDMIIGMCAKKFSIPVLHSSGFHQTKSQDYAAEYLSKVPLISLHKFEDIDPYKEYMDLLHVLSNRHEEL